jgi:hypothetical protein
MANDEVKAVQIRPQSSSLNVFWASSSLQTPSVLFAIRHAAARLHPHFGAGRRAAARHAAPARGRVQVSKHAPR